GFAERRSGRVRRRAGEGDRLLRRASTQQDEQTTRNCEKKESHQKQLGAIFSSVWPFQCRSAGCPRCAKLTWDFSSRQFGQVTHSSLFCLSGGRSSIPLHPGQDG